MSQINNGIPGSGPGSGTVTSITFNGGLTSTPDPVTTTGTATIDQTNLTVLDGTVYWDTGTKLLNTTATGTSGQVLTSNGAGVAPSYQPVTVSGTVTTLHTQDGNNVTPTAGVINISGGNNLTTTGTAGPNTATISLTGLTQHDVLVGGASNAITSVSPSTSGFVLTSNGVSADPSFQAAAFVAFPWTDVTGASVALVVNNGYTLDMASAVTATLPSTAAYGSIIEICAINTGLGSIAQNANQTIWFSTATKTTTGAGGSLTFTSQYGSIRLLCTTANTDFTVLSSSGTFTYV